MHESSTTTKPIRATRAAPVMQSILRFRPRRDA
jgi:hypothetical protein